MLSPADDDPTRFLAPAAVDPRAVEALEVETFEPVDDGVGVPA